MTPHPKGGHGEGEDVPWNRDRYGSRKDEDRADYGSGWDRQGGYGAGQDGEPATSDTAVPGKPRDPV
jgi:hypothetical protein